MTNKDWLKSLTTPQVRALASQRGVTEWKSLSKVKLVNYLAQFENIREPVAT